MQIREFLFPLSLPCRLSLKKILWIKDRVLCVCNTQARDLRQFETKHNWGANTTPNTFINIHRILSGREKQSYKQLNSNSVVRGEVLNVSRMFTCVFIPCSPVVHSVSSLSPFACLWSSHLGSERELLSDYNTHKNSIVLARARNTVLGERFSEWASKGGLWRIHSFLKNSLCWWCLFSNPKATQEGRRWKWKCKEAYWKWHNGSHCCHRFRFIYFIVFVYHSCLDAFLFRKMNYEITRRERERRKLTFWSEI